jgi:hypothetical protein
MTNYTKILTALALTGCLGDSDLPAYYDGGPAPEPTVISQHTELGNVGGDVVEIQGKNFGGNLNAITVVFGSQNAEILSVSEDTLRVIVPQGPIQGGRVDVSIATVSGQGFLPGGYGYDVGEILSDEVGYILVNDLWQSCLGGIGQGGSAGCNTIAYNGHTGIEGRAAFLDDIKFPNVHSMYVGWAGGSDMSWGQWRVQAPGQMANSFDMESSFENILFEDVAGFSLYNEAWDSSALREDQDEEWCTQINQMDRHRFSGGIVDGVYMPPFEVTGAGQVSSEDMGTSFLNDMTSGDEETCEDANGQRAYSRSRLPFCETNESDMPNTSVYAADWPVGRSFFGNKKTSDGMATFNERGKSQILVDVPRAGLKQSVTLPPAVKIYGMEGFDTAAAGGDTSLWGLVDLDSCSDSNGDGLFGLDDAAAAFEWAPFSSELSSGGLISDARTYVRVTLNVLDIGWFGGVGSSIRASITVPDDYGFDPDTNRSRVEIPSWVLYQMPKITSAWGTENSIGGSPTYSWGDPARSDYGYLVVTVDRVTEYAIRSATLGGDVIFAYATGDFGFMGWDNPVLEPDDCGDCSDNDGDGWTDSLDPDCRSGNNEDNASFGEYTCNDGVDNDNDGDVDAKDEDCSSGRDPESPECGDSVDNDGDGWVDSDDPDCTEGAGLFENDGLFGTYGCNNGVDDDGDGWIDSEDPACSTGTDPEDDGFVVDVECNDGVDNDGNGDIDAEDTLCANEGAANGYEQYPEPGPDCSDGVDNDEDGYTDSKDPDCDFSPFRSESKAFRDPAEDLGIDQCYDGMDNDFDGATDADDPGCLDADGTPNGFLNDESAALFEGGGEEDDTGVLVDDTGDSTFGS